MTYAPFIAALALELVPVQVKLERDWLFETPLSASLLGGQQFTST